MTVLGDGAWKSRMNEHCAGSALPFPPSSPLPFVAVQERALGVAL